MAKFKFKELKKKIKKAQELERFDKKVKKKNKKAIKKIMAIVDTMNANSELIAGVKKEHKSIDDLLDEVPHSKKKSKKSKKSNYMNFMDVTIIKSVPRPNKIEETSKEAKKAFTVPDTIDVKPIKVPAKNNVKAVLENVKPNNSVTIDGDFKEAIGDDREVCLDMVNKIEEGSKKAQAKKETSKKRVTKKAVVEEEKKEEAK